MQRQSVKLPVVDNKTTVLTLSSLQVQWLDRWLGHGSAWLVQILHSQMKDPEESRETRSHVIWNELEPAQAIG
jgi:hypothetical protein